MKKRLLILPLLAGFALSSCSAEDLMFWQKKEKEEQQSQQDDQKQEEEKKEVKSVTITGSKDVLGLGKELKLTATVVVTGDLSKSVSWKSSDTSIATVTAGGTVTGKKEGTVTITATSQADSTKSDSVTIQIVDQGFDPTLIDEGYTYVKSYPVAVIASYLGVEESEIVVPTTTSSGFYYKVNEAGENAGHVEVIADDVIASSYQIEMVSAGSTKYCETSNSIYETVSPGPSFAFTVAAHTDIDDDYDPIAPTSISYYKSADVWEDSTPSTDTEWDKDRYDEDTAEYYEDQTNEIIGHIPFLPIGKNYEISYHDFSLYRYFGYDLPDYVSIGDYSLADSLVEGFGDILTSNGFHYYEEDGVYYGEFGYDAYTVYEEFTEQGNTYIIVPSLAFLPKFPTEGVKDFVENVLESVKSVPDYEQTEGATFTFDVVEGYDDDYNPITYAEVMAYEIKATELAAYVDVLKEAGYSAQYTAGTDEDYPKYECQLGKICLQLIFIEAYDEATETFSSTDGDLAMYIFGDDTAKEIPGLYLDEKEGVVPVDGTYQLKVEAFELGEEPVISYSSSDEAIATVDETGLITGVAEGEAVITASTTYNDQEYKVEFKALVDEIEVYKETIDLTALGLKNQESVEGKSYTTDHGATVSFSKGTNKNEPKWYDNGNAVRCYGGNTITFSAPEGFVITEIKITFGTGGDSNTISVSSGKLTGNEWTGSASTVKFTIDGTSGNRRFASFEITFSEGEGGGDTGEYTLEKVKDDVQALLSAENEEYVLEWDSEYSEWGIGFTTGEATSTTESELKGIAETLLDFLPDYMVYDGYLYTPEDEEYYENATYTYVSPSGDIVIEISGIFISDEGELVASLEIYQD